MLLSGQFPTTYTTLSQDTIIIVSKKIVTSASVHNWTWKFCHFEAFDRSDPANKTKLIGFEIKEQHHHLTLSKEFNKIPVTEPFSITNF